MDQRAYLGFDRERVANAQRSDPRGETVHELGLDLGVDKDSLDRDAHLTGVASFFRLASPRYGWLVPLKPGVFV